MKQLLKIGLSLIFLGVVFSLLSTKSNPKQEVEGVHYSLNGTKEYFERAYVNVSLEKPAEKIAGITVNHHLLAANLVARQFSLIATDEPVTVVLISPNHFYRGNGGAISSRYNWETPYGVLEVDKEVIGKLASADKVNIDETPFTEEHGVSGVVGFIKKSLPNAKIVPILIKDNLSNEKADDLAKRLTEILPANSLIVGSIDFSHYLTHAGAQFHDAASLSVIETFDYNRLSRLDADSRPGLRLLLKYLEITGNQDFNLVSNENSSTVTGDYNFTETTSYINGYFTPGKPVTEKNTATLYVPVFPEEFNRPGVWDRLSKEYAFAKSERLFQYNDQTLTDWIPQSSETRKRMESLGFIVSDALEEVTEDLAFLELEGEFVAIGLLQGLEVTEIWLFPLKWVGGEVVLSVGENRDTMLEEMAARNPDPEVRKQIIQGKITIK